MDRSRPVRPGEEVDVEALSAWLAVHVPEATGSIEVEQFPAGHSNLTYLVRSGTREVVMRRPPFGARVGHDMGREFRVLSGIHRVWPLVPRPIAFCADEDVLGAPFYLMERVRGIVLRGPTPPPGVRFDAAGIGELSGGFVSTLAAIHAIDLEAAGLESLGRPSGYVDRQVAGWADRYGQARTDDVPSIGRVIEWLTAHRPPDSGAALIHNDFKYDNLVLDADDPTKVLAVLDWEMATVGDPLMDLGTSLAYWVDADDPAPIVGSAFGPTMGEGSLDRESLAARYAAETSRDVGNLVFYFAYGLFKLAVIVQQIYYRYHHGFTRDERFAGMNAMVAVLGDFAERSIRLGRISGLGG